jgi:hypothetical protein
MTMNNDGSHSVQPIFRFLIGRIRGYALCFLCIVTPWLWPVLIAGFLGGLWARRRRGALSGPAIIGLPPTIPPPLPPVIADDGRRWPAEDGIQSFAA